MAADTSATLRSSPLDSLTVSGSPLRTVLMIRKPQPRPSGVASLFLKVCSSTFITLSSQWLAGSVCEKNKTHREYSAWIGFSRRTFGALRSCSVLETRDVGGVL